MTSTFKAIVQDFKWVFDKSGRRMLQFTRTWVLKHPLIGDLGDSVAHCLCQKDHKGEIYWNPPLNYIPGGKGRKQLHDMTTPFYNHILEALKSSKFAEHLDIPVSNKKKAEIPRDSNPELPERIEIE